MDIITIQHLCAVMRENISKSKFTLETIEEKIQSNNFNCLTEKQSLSANIKNSQELLEVSKETTTGLRLVRQSYTNLKNKKITPEPDILEANIPRFGKDIKVGTQMRVFFDDFKPTVEESTVCTVVGFRRTKKPLIGKKPKDDLEIILLYEDKHNKGKVTTVGLSERFFNQCDLIE
ncbi:hypothetical protein HON36_01035 [Candidatus Parcubacteria bacterium]|nr:hypothetical protein [Candidatus Parcubacteria bacterium]MBT7228225.1 hypothetical protein [Candidatus Parcubacteria bacterium]